jgi:hypothetical protein
MKYLFVLLILFIVIVPAVSVARRFRSLKYDPNLDARLKELRELAQKEKEAREKQKEPTPPAENNRADGI